jgi:squalene-associated FAD-dependent desaturase
MGRGPQPCGSRRVKATVVGGGLAGITAALDLADAGAQVTLLEARPRLGGATFSIERDGLWLDNGQHVFLRCCTAYRALIDRLGVTHETALQDKLALPVLRPGGRVSWLRRAALPAPFHLAPSFARFGPLPWRDRARLLGPVRALQRLSLDDPALDDLTFAEWLAQHGQSERSLETMWDLFALPTLNLHASEGSLALAAMVFKTGMIEEADAADIGYATVPLQRLHGDAAERALKERAVYVRTKARIDSLAELDADAIVLAVPHDVAAELLPAGALAPGIEPWRLGVSPIVNLHVVYDRPVLHHPFAAVVDSPAQWVFDRTESSGLLRGQCVAVSLSGADEYLERTSAELQDEFVPALAHLLPDAASARVESFFATREPQATFRGVPGTAKHRPGPVTNVPGLFLAGAWTDTGWPATMEGAVRSGHAAAEAALSRAKARVAA